MTSSPSRSSDSSHWLDIKEAGTVVGMRFLLLACRLVGRRPTQLLLRVIVFYYAVFRAGARRASHEYRRRLGLPTSFWTAYRHMLRFSESAVDRVFFLSRQFDKFKLTRTGTHHLQRLAREGRGAVLLGAHLGSFDAMRACGDLGQLPINVVGYFGNARAINRVLQAVSGNLRTRLIEIQPGGVTFVFHVKELIERGELVAILADRTMGGPWAEVNFLGAPARFPTGPFILAATLRCPIYLTVSLYTAPDRYDIFCEPFADQITLQRGQRNEALRGYLTTYAERLEHYCRMSPDSWFNFFPFWGDRRA